MAVTVINTLYPPLIETFQPAFLYNTSAPVTFSISPFNNAADIKRIHISIVDQRNNSSVLKTTQEAKKQSTEVQNYYGIINSILIADFPNFNKNNLDIQKIGMFQYDPINDIYAINIPPEVLSKNEDYWNNNQYYQIQIRFDSCDTITWYTATSSNSTKLESTYLLDNREYFSEWSSITLIKPIVKPIIVLDQFSSDKISSTYAGNFHISGSLYFEFESGMVNGVTYPETEQLQDYKIIVTLNNKEIHNSNWVYARQNLAEKENTTIDYLLDLSNIPEESQLNFIIYCRTNNGYICKAEYLLKINNLENYFEDVKWNENLFEDNNQIDINQEDGIAKIRFSAHCTVPGIVYFRRACSKDHFKTWDLIYRYEYTDIDPNNPICNIPFDDYTIGSLYEYQYSAQICKIIQKQETWGNIVYSNKIYPKFYEMLLMRQNRQIAIRYNGQISSWKPTVNRQKIDTLGGKYPKFVENATMNYKTYQISGLISAEEDFNRKFLNEFDTYNDYNFSTDKYELKFKYQDDIHKYNDEFDTKYLIRNDTIADNDIVDSSIYDFHRMQSHFKIIVTEEEDERNPTTEKWYELHNNKYVLTTDTIIDINKVYYEWDGYKWDTINTNYTQLNNLHDVYLHDHWYWEREFREQLVNWLNDGEPKLYRSMPEGNIVVMLTDINLTPDSQLGRMLYNFSATMYEIEDGYSLDVLDKLNIITIPQSDAVFLNSFNFDDDTDDDEDDINTQIKFGQMTLFNTMSATNWVNGTSDIEYDSSQLWDDMSIRDKLKAYYSGTEFDITDTPIRLSNITIDFQTSPHYFIINSSGNFELNWNAQEEREEISDWLGYVIVIQEKGQSNPKQIFINQRGYYHIPNEINVENIQILGANIPQKATIFYQYKYKTKLSEEYQIVEKSTTKNIIGQYTADKLPLDINIIDLIIQNYEKINYNNNDSRIIDKTSLKKCKGLLLDITPYTYITYIQEKEAQALPLIIGNTGIFDMFEDWPLTSLIILGRRMTFKIPKNNNNFEDWEYKYFNDWECFPCKTGQTKENIIYPTFNTVYPDNNQNKWIYYIDGNWYPIDSQLSTETTIIAKVPVYGIINYQGELERVTY